MRVTQRLSSGMAIGPCGKRVFASQDQAKRAHQKAHFRIRSYWCDQCHGFHATNAEKK